MIQIRANTGCCTTVTCFHAEYLDTLWHHFTVLMGSCNELSSGSQLLVIILQVYVGGVKTDSGCSFNIPEALLNTFKLMHLLLISDILYKYIHTCLYNDAISLFIVQNGITSLYLASQGGHSDVVDVLLKSGADPNVTTMV